MQNDRLIRRAARQHWLITRRQAEDLGFTRRQLELRLASGALVKVHREVYAVGGAPPTFEQKALAACLATGGVASHRTAAAQFGLRGVRRGPIEITVTGRRAPRLDGVTTHETARLDKTKIGVVPVTMPAQTLLDLAGVEPRLVEGALADALRRELVRLPTLVRFLQGAGRSGRGSYAYGSSSRRT